MGKHWSKVRIQCDLSDNLFDRIFDVNNEIITNYYIVISNKSNIPVSMATGIRLLSGAL